MTSFDTRLTILPASLWQRITQIDEIKGEWRHGAGLGPQVLGRLKRSVLVTSTGASTRIEGAQLSDADVERLMRGLSTQRLADRDAQEVRGYYEVLQLVFDSWQTIQLTENTIKQLHGQLLQYTSKDQRHRGQYKTLDNTVQATDPHGQVVSVLFDTTPAYLTAKQMDELISWTTDALAAGIQHPLAVIGNFVVEFLKIHPFLDGNGRLSRILTNLLLLRAGYGFVPYVSHEHLIEAHKAAYYLALRRSQTTFGTQQETIQPWLEFFLDTCRAQAEQAIELLSTTAIEQSLSPRQLLVWHYLGTVPDAAPGEIASATSVPQPTVAQSLNKLLGLGKVERFGLGRATRYRRTGRQTAAADDKSGREQ
ncbi:Fic family protein [Kibdelosporangium aridum]|uniref:Fic family protein n=1 Tax=Kibdelosporangium aridum TaxID=2030 RepID=A0A1W2EZM1_KIBAR|nr:Fic family protein [Kibdelosporangium aridum]SMD14666.1 Fic family protein [Kibdelosporangium aridum]